MLCHMMRIDEKTRFPSISRQEEKDTTCNHNPKQREQKCLDPKATMGATQSGK